MINLQIGGQVDIDAHLNETWRFSIALTDRLGAPVILTGAAVTMELRKRVTDVIPAYSFTLANRLTIGGTDNNYLVANLTDAVQKGTYYHQTNFILAGGDKFKLYGTATFT